MLVLVQVRIVLVLPVRLVLPAVPVLALLRLLLGWKPQHHHRLQHFLPLQPPPPPPVSHRCLQMRLIQSGSATPSVWQRHP